MLWELLTGHDHFGMGALALDGDDPVYARQRKVWDAIREPFLAEHVARCPGTRPWAWWLHDAPELRRQLDAADVELRRSPAAVDWMGMPSAYGLGRWESQGAYLDRLGLLMPGETPDGAELEPEDPATAYARAVVAGEVVVGRLVLLACERHLTDLRDGPERGLYFNRRLVDRRLSFSRYIRHYEGRWAGEVFVPQPWQCFCTGSIFGWVRADGFRRFRTSYREIARKMGKTFMGAEDCLYLLLADGENSPEIFVAATKREQAEKPYGDLIAMVRKSPVLQALTREMTDRLWGTDRGFIRTMASNPSTEDSHHVHSLFGDEIHEWRKGELLRVMEQGTVARDQPLMNLITTAGFNAQGFGGRRHELYSAIVDPHRPETDDRAFVYIAALDDKAEVDDEAAWPKVMPNLGVSVTLERMREEVESARVDPERWTSTLVKHFNIWQEVKERWLKDLMDEWRACAGTEDPRGWRARMLEELRGQRCYGGLDCATRRDITALALWFPDVTPPVVLPFFWIPEQNLHDRVDRDQVPYDVWWAHGFLTATSGNVIDHRYVISEIAGAPAESEEIRSEGLAQRYQIQEIAYDDWGPGMLVAQELQDDCGLTMVRCFQGWKTMSPPMKELEALIAAGAFHHGGNPILAWNAANIAVKPNPQGAIMPDKGARDDLGRGVDRMRIDGMVALIMALWRALLHREQGSAYEDHGPLVWTSSSIMRDD